MVSTFLVPELVGRACRAYLLSMRTRLSALETSALQAFASALRARFGCRLRALTLFGSRARGAGRDDSDLDVLVLIEAMTRTDRRAVQDLSADLGLAYRLVFSPLVADATAWRRDLPLGRSIEEEGVAL